MYRSNLLEISEAELGKIQIEIIKAGKDNPVDFIKHLCELEDEEMVSKTWISYLFLSNYEEPVIAESSFLMVRAVKKICYPLYVLKKTDAPEEIVSSFADFIGIDDGNKLLEISEMVTEMETREIQVN